MKKNTWIRMLYQKKVYLLLLTIIPLDPSVRLASKWSLSKSVYTHFITDRWKRIKFISLEVKISTNIHLPNLLIVVIKWNTNYKLLGFLRYKRFGPNWASGYSSPESPFLKLHSVKWKSKEICIVVLYFTSIECEEQGSIKFIKKSACSRTYKNRRIFETQLNETCFTKRK